MTEKVGATRFEKRSRNRITAVMIVAALLVALVVAGALIGAIWEAAPEPSSSLGLSGALRVWLAVAAGVTTAIATVCLAWFARRVPSGVGSLLRRLELAEEAHRKSEEARVRAEEAHSNTEAERDALVRRLSLPYLYGHALDRNDLIRLGSSADVRVGDPLMGDRVAPDLYISLPRGRLPQQVRLDKGECQELFAEIERAEHGDGEVAVARFANVVLAVAVIDPHDDQSTAGITLHPNSSRAGPGLAFGVLPDWPSFREAVERVANHRLPSLAVLKQKLSEVAEPEAPHEEPVA